MVHGPFAGLEVVYSVTQQLQGHARIDAARADLFELAGDGQAAPAHHWRRTAPLQNRPPI